MPPFCDSKVGYLEAPGIGWYDIFTSHEVGDVELRSPPYSETY